jgi:5S rRNA maturation endonuclease (ribonuclease M5)
LVNLEKRIESIYEVLDKLLAEAIKGIPIIVEGRKDVESLRKLGIEGDIIMAKSSGKTSSDVIREIENKHKQEVIVLLDFDRRGRELTKRLVNQFERGKIKSYLSFWKNLQLLVGRDVKDIEGLHTYVETLMEKSGSKNK